MRTPSPRFAKIVALLVTPAAVVAAGAMVFHASFSAFSAETRNSGNSWSTGQVALTNDSAGTARFVVTNMLPGQTETKCISVTANVTVSGTVKGYAVNPVTSVQGLENHILLTAYSGTGGSFSSCSGFVANPTPEFQNITLATLFAANSYANGIGGWNVSPGTQTRTYQISWTFDSTGMTQDQLDALQGAHTGVDFEWELQTS
jgi:hypothetical protein